MITEQIYDGFRFPYIWPSVVKENMLGNLDDRNKSTSFTHLHLKGSAGSGKTRCIAEILKLKQKKVTNLYYSTPSESAFNVNIVEFLMHQINQEHSYHSIDKNNPISFAEKNLCKTIKKISNKNNIIIVIEDLHYRDDLRDSFLSKLIGEFSDQLKNVTLITSSRNRFELSKSHNFHTVEITNLSKSEAKSLIKYGSNTNNIIKKTD